MGINTPPDVNENQDAEIAALINELKKIPNPDHAIVRWVGQNAAISVTGMIVYLEKRHPIALKYLAEIKEKGWRAQRDI